MRWASCKFMQVPAEYTNSGDSGVSSIRLNQVFFLSFFWLVFGRGLSGQGVGAF